MRPQRRLSNSTFIVLGAILLLASPQAFAYLDPSTGSMVVSAIVGIFASIALALKTYWYKIKKLFARDKKEEVSSRKSGE